jgi:hypothetical protein
MTTRCWRRRALEYGPHCRYDKRPGTRHPFGIAQLSLIDHFHPNVEGQAQLADLTWLGSPDCG